MPKGKIKRCKTTGISLKKFESFSVDDTLMDFDGHIRPDAYPDCNVYGLKEIARAAGYNDPHYFKKVITDPSSPFHLNQIIGISESGNKYVLAYATHVDSASFGGERHKAKTSNTSKSNLKQTKK